MKFALSPLPWLATEDGGTDYDLTPPWTTLFPVARRLGFDAVTAVPPDAGDAEAYARALDGAGLKPAPGYLAAPLSDVNRRDETVARAGALAARCRLLGLDDLFVGMEITPQEPRLQHPAIGFAADVGRLSEITRTLTLVGHATLKHGVRACLHPHVGSSVETEDELEWLLGRIDPEVLALGPDTGHLAWAGVDLVDFARRHRDRIEAVHLKDMRLDIARRTRGSGESYKQIVLQGLWAEPGLGDLDLVGFLEALRPQFKGWVVIEVDRPSLASIEESVTASRQWIESMTSVAHS